MSSPVRIYLSGDPVHDRVLTAFHEGCPGSMLVSDWQYEPSPVAVVFGVYKSKIPASFKRGQTIAQQRSKNLDVIVLETGYINRGDGKTHHYAAGWNGLNGRADFRNKHSPADRWEKLGTELMPWRDDGEYVVLCGQVPWDASVDHSDHLAWLAKAARQIRANTKRPIRFRPHPKAILPSLEGCDYSTSPLWEDLIDAHAVVTFNSNSAVEAAIAGVPVFAFDKGSMAWPVATYAWWQMEKPQKPSRTQWAHDLAYTQWTLDEMRGGEAWSHLQRPS